MSDAASLEAFLDKWRARWPEWRIAEVFVPAPQRAATLAWLALRQELADAAWGGADPRPGAAKLAWWSDELRGWAQGRRRHPLGLALQRLAAPWEALAEGLPALAAARERPLATGDDVARWQVAVAPFVSAGAGVSGVIAATTADATTADSGDAFGASLCVARALAGDGSAAAARPLLAAWPSRPAGTRADRVFAAVSRLRLQALAGGHGPAGQWRVPWAAWRAGRSVPRA